jgi:hypothetical protein
VQPVVGNVYWGDMALWERYDGSDWVVGEVHLGHTGLWERCRL